MPHPPLNTVPPVALWRSAYDVPTRGAKLSCVVRYIGVPDGASARLAGSAVASVNAPLLSPLSPGGGFSSHRRPYVSENRSVASHVSWPNAEAFVACEKRFVTAG